VLVLVAAGCQPMPKGDPALAKDADVVLLRGWRDMYSDGVNHLADKLEAEGYRTAVLGEAQWKPVADALIGRRAPAVLIGFSYGADHAIDIARRLNEKHIAVPLLITLDPVTPPRVPGNVAVCHNLYQSSGIWDVFPWFRGIPLKTDSPRTMLTNIDVHRRPDLDNPAMAHKTIAGSEAIHREILLTLRKHAPR
jgi:pimeloyl-ACP methyl ester carboxylesterase